MKKRILGILLSLIMAVGMLPTMAMAQEPAPTFNLEKDLKDITIPEHLVTCICITTGESKPYGQLTGGFTTDGKVIKKNGEWTVIVRIYKKTYMEKFNTDTGTTHSPKQNDSSDFTTPIQSELKHNGEKWELMDQIPTGTELHFTCDGKHKPSVPMFSNITDISEKLVAVSCTNVSGGPSGEFYGLIDGAFTATEPILNSDGVYESTITLNAKEYLKKFNTDTGILHSLVSEVDTEGKKIDPVFVVKYDHDRRMWVPKEATKNLIIFVNCEKHETQPQPPNLPTIDKISGLNDKIVAVLCANTQEGQEAGKYYGLLDGGFTSTKPELNDGMFESTLTLIPSVYCKQYSTDTGITHRVNPNQTTEGLTFVVEYDEAEKMWRPKEEVRSMGIWVYCEKHETQPQPPNLPTIDKISGLNDKIVAVLCANTQEGQEAGKYYGLLDGGFTSTKPELNDGMFESTLTLIPSVYCKQYSTDTGITHRVNPNQTTEGLKFVVKYDEEKKMWRPKEEVRLMGIWVYCEKHETQPQPPVIPVYPPSGGGSTIYPGGTPGGNGTIVNPDNNQGNQQPTVDSKDKQGNNKTKKIKKSDTMEKVPKTGDNTAMTIWLVLLLLSVGALFGTVAFDRKRKRI